MSLLINDSSLLPRLSSRTREDRPSHLADSLGFGIGLRPCHVSTLLQTSPGSAIENQLAPDWLEVITENYMDDLGLARHTLHRLRSRFPIAFHGVSLSIGSQDPLRRDYLEKLKVLCHEFAPAWISDHLCWTGIGGINSHDLLPLPLHRESLQHVISRVHQVQDFLGRPLILENPSSYIAFRDSDMPEWEFLNQLCDATGAGLLLDLNNVYVSAFNLGFNAKEYVRQLNTKHVMQVHVAGPRHCGTHIIDTHDSPVVNEVWQLYADLICRRGAVSTLLEWDAHIPELAILLKELNKARQIFLEHSSISRPDYITRHEAIA